MKIEIDKEDLIRLVKGCDLSYEDMNHPLVDRYGYCYGGVYDRWNDDMGDKVSELDLIEMYRILTGKVLVK